jgi:hypothetical protein
MGHTIVGADLSRLFFAVILILGVLEECAHDTASMGSLGKEIHEKNSLCDPSGSFLFYGGRILHPVVFSYKQSTLEQMGVPEKKKHQANWTNT